MMPQISVIVPVYNVEKYLQRCVDSLINQSLKDIEIILVDDGSPDNCPAMCDDYAKTDARVKVIHKRNEGLGFARNSGLEAATGEFIAFVDSDDYVDWNTYEALYKKAKELNLDTLFYSYDKFDERTGVIGNLEINEIDVFDHKNKIMDFLLDMVGTEPESKVDRKYQVSACCAIYSYELLKANNIAFHSERELISEDLIFQMDYLPETSRVGYWPKTFYHYCTNYASLSQSFRQDRFLKYKQFYHELNRRLNLIFNKEEFECRTQRLFIGYTRSLLFSVHQYTLPYKNKISIIKQIINDPIWEDVKRKYPYEKLPAKHKYVLRCILDKNVYLLFLLGFLKNKRLQ